VRNGIRDIFSRQKLCLITAGTPTIGSLYPGAKLESFINIGYSPVKIQFNPQKNAKKVFQLILLGFSVLYNILKVYPNRSLGKVFF